MTAEPKNAAAPFSSKMSDIVRRHWRVLACLFAVYVIWGSTYLGMLIALESLPPFLMGGARFIMAGSIVYAVQRASGAQAPSARQWRSAFVVGVLLLVCGNGFIAVGQQRKWASSGVSAVIVTTMPLFMALLTSFTAFAMRRAGHKDGPKPPSPGEWLGLLVGFFGAVLLRFGGAVEGSIGAIFLMLLSPFCWALGSLMSRSMDLPKGLIGSGMQMICGGVAMLAVGLSTGESISRVPTFRSLAALAYLVVFGSIVGFSAYGYLLRHTRPAIATSYAYVNPIVAIALGIWLAGERSSMMTWLAACIVIAGVLILSLSRAERAA